MVSNDLSRRAERGREAAGVKEMVTSTHARWDIGNRVLTISATHDDAGSAG